MAKPVCAGLVVLLLIAVSVLESCSSRDEETAIRELVKKGATLGEGQDIKGLMNLTTEDFVALPGDLRRQETRGILFMAFRHYQNFKILYPRPSVELKTRRAVSRPGQAESPPRTRLGPKRRTEAGWRPSAARWQIPPDGGLAGDRWSSDLVQAAC